MTVKNVNDAQQGKKQEEAKIPYDPAITENHCPELILRLLVFVGFHINIQKISSIQ
jgi:hypothetical protein